jgi:hypothetical protein
MRAAISGPEILLQEMATGDEVRPLRLRQELLPARAEGRIIEDIVFAAPNDRGRQAAALQLLLEPDEPVEGARGLIERNPTRPDPGQESRRRVG